jgi:large subunit ribosomal protein L18
MKTQRRRRKEAKTDYKARFNLLKSERPRLVVRKTNRYIIAQVVESDIAQDKVIATVTSKDLLEKGWPKEKSGSLKSLAAAYLTGYLLAKNKKLKSKNLIFDMGLHRNVPGARVYAALKGAIDGGLEVAHNPEALPTLERIKANKSTSGAFDKTKEKI